ncbi:hypothetical protein D4R99_05215, partial [bacterium]
RAKLGGYTVRKNIGDTNRSATRTRAHFDTSMIETPLDVYAVGLENEIVAQFESNDMLLQEHIKRMADALRQQFDKDFIAAGMLSPFVYETTASGVLSWKDLVKPKKHFTLKQVQPGVRVTIIDGDLEDQFWDIDVVKQASAFSIMKFANGDQKIEMLNQIFFISGLMPKLGGQPCLLSVHGQGLASIISKFGVMKQVYDATLLSDILDMLAHAAFALDDDKFACVIKLKA